MIRAVIFDFDGVILDSANIKTEAFTDMFKGYGELSNKFVEYHMTNMGISRYKKFRYFYEELLGEDYKEDLDEILGKKFSSLVLNKILHAEPVKGAIEFLTKFQDSLKLFIASGTPQEELEYIMVKRGLLKYFNKVYGSPRKKEEIIDLILLEQQLKPNEVIFVGDAISDLKAAKYGKLHFYARVYEENKKHFCNEKHCYNDLTMLDTLVKQL